MLKAHCFATRPFALALTRAFSILTIVSLLAPIAAIGEDSRQTSSARKRTARQATPPPNNAPPEPFTFPREDRKADGFLAEALSYFSTTQSVIHDQKSSEQVSLDTPNVAQDAKKDDAVVVEVPSTEKVTPAEPETPTAPAPEAETDIVEPEAPAMFTQPAGTVDFDFDGDGKSDVGRWNPSTLDFVVKNSNGGTLTSTNFYLASSSAKSAPADYDNDGITDMAVFDSGTWYIRKSSDSTHNTISSFGQAGDVPMSGDYRGGSGDELAVYRPSNQTWYWREFGSATVYSQAYGNSGDVPASGDYDGDGKMDLGLYRPSTGYWYITYNAGGTTSFQWGIAVDIPVVADYDNDGKSDAAVYRPTSGQWWVLYSGGGNVGGAWGNPGDQPVVGDFDGDGKSDWSIYRPSTGRWHIFRSSTLLGHGESLGQAGDTAVTSSYIVQTGANIAPDIINTERLKARNANGGTDLFSQNFGWSRGVVGLPGRSGMDLGLGISYNSLIWTKVGTAMIFNPDWDHAIAPGFKIGFPTVEPAYLDSKTGQYHYLMQTPGGSKVEFVQKDASSVYETLDSSYTQLVTSGAINPTDAVQDITITIVTTGGTRMSYEWDGGAFRCKQVKDKNGNYISITYDPNDQGLINTVTDTLGRVLSFNYDSSPNLTSISQTWKGSNGSGSNTTHTWATITYGTKTINADFDASLTQYGIYNSTDLKVVDKITYPDGSFTKFHYNDYGQAFKIEEHAADSTGGTPHVLNHVRVNLHTSGGGALAADQTDVPRYTQVWNYVENFNSGTETTATMTRSTGHSYTSPAGGSAMTTTKIEMAMSSHPHNAVSKSWYGESGWKDGLLLATEDWADGTVSSERKRWTLTTYDQDEPSFTYKVNPRVIETKVGDGVNTKRTTIDYDCEEFDPAEPTEEYGLPCKVTQYDADQTTPLKWTITNYDWDESRIGYRLIGLPAEVKSYGINQLTSSSELASKVTFAYDEGNFSDSGLQQNISPVQHDSSNYGSGFGVRGNLTSTKRWDATAPTTGASAITTSTLKYNTAGSVVAKITPWDGLNTRTIKIGYADDWNSSGNPTTYAYPTTLTDPANNASTVEYRYDIGANVQANSPAPAGQTYGKTTKRIFDSIGRLERNSVYVNTTEHSYVRYEFPTSGIHSKVYAPIVDQDGDGNLAEDEVLTESWSDGAGRVRMSRIPHTFSSGTPVTWAGTMVEYDILGQVKRQSVPTEVDGSFDPAGDDLVRGYLWTHQKYDWMGRVVRKINTDGTDSPTLNDSDTLITYAGCGCAGNLETTIEGENVYRDDMANTKARRKQKVYADILGRQWKTVLYKWDGTTAFTTTETFFNARDQILKTKQTDNTSVASPQTFRETIGTFDGHGRPKTLHYPVEDEEAETTWNYNLDGSVAQAIDPRGVTTDITYNSVGLKTQIAYTPIGTIPDTPTVTMTYDSLGNRLTMDTPGVNEITYSYDSLSRMTSEVIDFDDTVTNYTIGYTYDLSGTLKTLTEPFGKSFTFTTDKVGRLSDVDGTAFGSNTSGSYAAGIQYRAFGQVKQMTGYDMSITTQHDNRLRVSHYQAHNGVGYVLKAGYEYDADSKVTEIDNEVDDLLDQWNKYDYAGRLTYNEFGSTLNINAEEIWTYTQALYYNGFSEMTFRDTTTWNVQSTGGGPMLNGRQVPSADELEYDAAGNLLANEPNVDNWQKFTYDSAGRQTVHEEKWKRGGPISGQPVTRYHGEANMLYDGDGRLVRQHWDKGYTLTSGSHSIPSNYRRIYSTVIGQELSSIEENLNGEMKTTKVFAGGAWIGEQESWTPTGNSTSYFYRGISRDPISGSKVRSGILEHYEPLGQVIDPNPPLEDPPPPGMTDGYNDSRFAGIQCQGAVARGLEGTDVPWACRRSAEEDIRHKVIALWPSWNEKDGNLSKMVDSPIMRDWAGGSTLPHSFAAKAMVGSMFSTKKDDPQDGGDLGSVTIEDPGPTTPLDELAGTGAENGFGYCGGPGQPPCPKTDCNDSVLIEVVVADSGDGATSKRPYMNRAVANDFNKAINEIAEGGVTIGFNELFRPFAVQQAYWQAYKNNGFKPVGNILKAANTDTNPYPGPSNHGAGFSFDIMLRNRAVDGKPYQPHYNKTLSEGPDKGKTVEQIFNRHGFFRNEPNDEPHFNYKRKATYAEKLAAQNYFRDCLGDKY